MVGERNWSSLIDSQQYGGPLLYPKNNQLYNWSDANNTFLASELPNGWTVRFSASPILDADKQPITGALADMYVLKQEKVF